MLGSVPSALLLQLGRKDNCARFFELVDKTIAAEEARAQAEEAERLAAQEAGARINHEAELERCFGQGLAGLFHWVDTWVWTFDPRLLGKKNAEGKQEGAYIRMRLWPRQRELVEWLYNHILGQDEGAVDKSRDIGFTYVAVIVCLWFWLNPAYAGFKATFGSRDAPLVDNLNDPDSIFEKLRIVARRLPAWMMPEGFSWRTNDNLFRFNNPANGSVISGEVGDEMGRGGRSSVFIVDEAAFLARAHRVERSVSGNADSVIWASSSNGMGTFFYRKKGRLGAGHLFRFHYSDDPRKTAEWVSKKKASMDPVAWASEYEIDDTASVEGVCIPAAWVVSAQKLAKLEPGIKRVGRGISGGDVGGGKAKSVVVHRFGPIVLAPARRQDGDTTETAHWMLDECKSAGTAVLNFDAPGVGAGVQSTLRTAAPETLEIQPVNTGLPPDNERVWPDERTSDEVFYNRKAELWWLARTAFQKTHEHVRHLEGEVEARAQALDELVALPDDQALAFQLSLPKWFKREAGGKIIIESKEQLSKRGVPSPDEADAFVLTFLEAVDDGISGLAIDATAGHRANPWAVGSWGDQE